MFDIYGARDMTLTAMRLEQQVSNPNKREGWSTIEKLWPMRSLPWRTRVDLQKVEFPHFDPSLKAVETKVQKLC